MACSYDESHAVAPSLHVDFLPLSGVAGVEPHEGSPLRALLAPNPMPGSGVLHFTTPRAGPVRADLFDVRGRRVRVLLETPALQAGTHEVRIEAHLTPGVYLYRIRADDGTATGRCLVLE